MEDLERRIIAIENKIAVKQENDWSSWGRAAVLEMVANMKHILSELERQNKQLEALAEKISQIRTDITMLKVKSGMWGAAAGAIPALGAFIYWLVK